MQETVLERCQAVFRSWEGLTSGDFDFDDPKGFSSFTMGVRSRVEVEPRAVLYRQLGGKENAILDFATEREVFLLLGRHGIAARCYHYDATCRLEEFYQGRTLTAEDVFDPEIQRRVADELHRFHQLQPENLPRQTFFELLSEKWGSLASEVLGPRRSELPVDEQRLCNDLAELYSDETMRKVRRCLPDRPPVFCHNDTYHGNVFLLDDGTVKLLDFEFSCLNHAAFDFANLFAETTLQHGLSEPPHFRLVEPSFNRDDLATFIGFYLDNRRFPTEVEREAELESLVAETCRAVLLSDYMYAMAAIPLALEPMQRIRFVPYAHQRFERFLTAWEREFGDRSPV
jgi:thiamine kinase-like enzyme